MKGHFQGQRYLHGWLKQQDQQFFHNRLCRNPGPRAFQLKETLLKSYETSL